MLVFTEVKYGSGVKNVMYSVCGEAKTHPLITDGCCLPFSSDSSVNNQNMTTWIVVNTFFHLSCCWQQWAL
jgi:hypothetical protein